jgi:CBS domain containing-hemolysin-like protein
VEYLNEKYDLDIPEGDSYSTLGGFIVDSLNEIPQKGAQFSIAKFRFSIEEATAKKIELVRMTVSD